MKNKILILSTPNDPHVDFVMPEFKRRNLNPICFYPEKFPQKIKITTNFKRKNPDTLVKSNRQKFNLSEVKSVWYRRPFPPKVTPLLNKKYKLFAMTEAEAFINYLFDSLQGALWVSKPNKIERARNKLLQLSLASKIGLKTPEMLITNEPARVKEFYDAHNGDIIIKPIKAERVEMSRNYRHIFFTNKVKRESLKHLKEVSYSPCYFQEEIKKKYELRITVVGNKVFPAELHSQSNDLTRVDWRYAAEEIPYKKHKLPPSIEKMCLSLIKKLDLKFGAIDMVLTPREEYVFLEINPNGQWGWIERKTGLPIRESLVDLLQYGRN